MLTHGTQLLRATAKAAFWQAYETQPDIMGSIVYVTDSSSDQETYPFTSAAPSPVEMEGSRTHKSVPEISYVIKNKKWEADFSPLDPMGLTFVDKEYSKAYLRHLFAANEYLGKQIATLHNLGFYLWLVRESWRRILDGTFGPWKDQMVRQMDNRL